MTLIYIVLGTIRPYPSKCKPQTPSLKLQPHINTADRMDSVALIKDMPDTAAHGEIVHYEASPEVPPLDKYREAQSKAPTSEYV